MKLDKAVLRERIRGDFAGNLLFICVHADGGNAARAVAQLTRDPRVSGATGPQTLQRRSSAIQHIGGLLHHDPRAAKRER